MNRILSTKGVLTFVYTLFTLSFYAQDNFGGLALYTVRENMGEDAKATLQKVADAGYSYVEAAGYEDGKFYGMEPKEFKSYLKSIGLKPVSTHMGGVTLENADQQIADTKAAGFEYFTVPVPPMGMFTFDRENRTMGMKGTMKEFVDVLTTLGKKCKAAGLKLLYHNHDFEYKDNDDGIKPIVYLLENTDPKYVNFQMDLYWVTRAGADPVAYFEKYPGRFKLWHVKDMDEEGKFAPVGEGTIDFARILKEKKTSGMKKYFVEQDMTWDKKPLEVIEISHKGLKEIGFH
ncbi:sugar phosphate isomerase/epimerase [Muricauda sp. 334s03]|uniref:Sugar phosphate isomerase/epimerase n=1 Tax=Flagellimonas yonaguniensis TaxID=3031325 RepID=A0ABT5Y3D7_9FLAO|nr:sugar phosphate isomerase/epimerase [[Muricauda] yonaguniensis]MDF0717956.1 sugar phosphate isomerase/epimerase [[Muricauda] yonaguniensis]